MSDECGSCGGLGYIQEKKGRRACECRSLAKVQVYLRRLLPLSPVPEMEDRLKQVVHQDNLLIRLPDSLKDTRAVRWVFAFLLLRGGLIRTYDFLLPEDLVQVKMGTSEKYSSVGRIGVHVLGIPYGFYDVDTKLTGDVLFYTMNTRESRGLRNHVFMRGSPVFSGPLVAYAQEQGYQVVDLRGFSQKSKSRKGFK